MSTDNNEASTNVNIWEDFNERQIEAISFKLLNPDATYDDISNELNIPKGTLQQWRLCQLADKVRANKLQSTIDFIERLSIKAARVLEKQLDSDDEKVAQTAAKDLLDRFMGKATQSQQIDMNATIEDVTELTNEQREARIAAIVEEQKRRGIR